MITTTIGLTCLLLGALFLFQVWKAQAASIPKRTPRVDVSVFEIRDPEMTSQTTLPSGAQRFREALFSASEALASPEEVVSKEPDNLEPQPTGLSPESEEETEPKPIKQTSLLGAESSEPDTPPGLTLNDDADDGDNEPRQRSLGF